jgi:EmrB/QacA subfamily drug resistance transporter
VGSRSTFSRGLALLVAATFFMENLDGTIIQTAAPAMAATFGVQPADLSVAMVAYLLAVGVGIPATAWLSDRFGVRVLFLSAVVVFTVASLLCALAPTLGLLTAARVLQGIGGALMVPVGRLAVLRSVTPTDLLDAMAYLTWPALLAPVVAPALGGLLADTVGWHWIFLINLPIGVVAFVAGLVLVPRIDERRHVPFDGWGFAFVAGALVLVTAGAEILATSTDATAIAGAAAIVAGVCVGWAGALVMRRREHPLFDGSVLRIRTFRAANVSGAFYRLMVAAAPFLFTLLFQVVYGWPAFTAGLVVMAVFIGNIAIKPATTPLIRRLGFRPVLVWSNVIGAVILAVFVVIGPTAPLPLLLTLLFLSGVFRSIGFSAYNTIQFVDVPPDRTNAANTLASTLQQAATALGLAIVAVFINASTWAAGGLTGHPLLGYHWAFALAALTLVIPLVGALLLPADAGRHAVRRA